MLSGFIISEFIIRYSRRNTKNVIPTFVLMCVCDRCPTESSEADIYHYASFGVGCTEVEIDCLTGDHTVGCRCLSSVAITDHNNVKQM